MGFIKSIYLKDELYPFIKKETNLSDLINAILIKHYNAYGKSEEEIIEDVKQKIEDKQKAAEREAEKVTAVIDTAFEFFGFKLTEEQAKEYLTGDYKTLEEYIQQQQSGTSKSNSL